MQQGYRKGADVHGAPWQMELSEVPLMWKPASQLQCWAWSTFAQRGRLLKAGSFMTLHSGGAEGGEREQRRTPIRERELGPDMLTGTPL